MKIEYKMSVLATMMDSVQYYFYSLYMAILP
ncbi:hypothetical protein AT864_01849 [Anoxybacillus sp. P3H1B]|nr:hypothetical protein AT864_01849 [Anoxybacillus sp. P3H1B]